MRAKAFWISLASILTPTTSLADTPPVGASYTFTTGSAALEWHPFRLWHAMIVTDVLLDGKLVPAVLDTGATVSASLDDGPLGAGKALPIEAIGGHVAGNLDHYDHVQIGGAQATHGPLVHIATGLMKDAPFRLILGMDFIRNFALQLDWSKHQLRFLAPGDIPADKPFWSATARPIYPGAPEKGEAFFLDVTLCGHVTKARLDTGANDLLYMGDADVPASSCPSVVDSDSLGRGGGGAVLERTMAFKSLAIGAQDLGALPINVMPASGLPSYPGSAMAIGNGLLRRFNYTLDATSGRFVMWGPGDTSIADINTTGLVLFDDDAPARRVEHVMKGSPAMQAGIKHGDSICRFNEAPLPAADKDTGRSIVTPAAEIPVTYTLCDGRKIRVVPRDFLGEIATLKGLRLPTAYDAPAPLTQGMAECQQGKVDACRIALSVTQAPIALRWMTAAWMTKAAEAKGDLATAVEAADTSIALGPNNPASQVLRAEVAMMAERDEDCVTAARKALQLAPEMVPARQFLTLGLLLTGHTEEGLASAQILLEKAPDNPMVIGLSSYGLLESDRLGQARVQIDKALLLAPNVGMNWAINAMIAQREGNKTSAEADLAKAIQISPHDRFTKVAQAAVMKHPS